MKFFEKDIVDKHIQGLSKSIERYKSELAVELGILSGDRAYQAPELIASSELSVRNIRLDISDMVRRLDTMKVIRDNGPVTQVELDFLTQMPVFKEFTAYGNVEPKQNDKCCCIQ